jgi:hypothetical protein
LHVRTNHSHLACNALNSQERVLQARLFLEERHPTFHSLKGANDVLTNALSWSPHQAHQSTTGLDQPHLPSKVSQTVANNKESNAPSALSILVDDQDMLECFLDFPAISPQHPFALDHATSNQSFASKPNQHGRFQMTPAANLMLRFWPCSSAIQNMPSRCCVK